MGWNYDEEIWKRHFKRSANSWGIRLLLSNGINFFETSFTSDVEDLTMDQILALQSSHLDYSIENHADLTLFVIIASNQIKDGTFDLSCRLVSNAMRFSIATSPSSKRNRLSLVCTSEGSLLEFMIFWELISSKCAFSHKGILRLPLASVLRSVINSLKSFWSLTLSRSPSKALPRAVLNVLSL